MIMTIMMTMMQIFANAWFAIGWEPVVVLRS